MYAANKLSEQEMALIERIKQLFHYFCGSSLQELNTEDNRTPQLNALVEKMFDKDKFNLWNIIRGPLF